MEDIYEDIGGYNPTRKRKILLVFDDIIAGIMSNKKFQTVIVYDMQKTKYTTCIFHTVLPFCSKRCQIKFNLLFNYEN